MSPGQISVGNQQQCTSSSPLDLEDIEDLFTGFEDEKPGFKRSNLVVPKVKKKVQKKGEQPENQDEENCSDFLPGQAKIYVKTWGCSHNVSDGEYMAGQLAEQGYTITEDKQEANLWLLNSCTVKSPSEDHFRNEVDRGLDKGKKVVVAGCVPQGKPNSAYIKGLSVVGVQQIDRVVEVVEETLKGNQVRLFGSKKVTVSEDEAANGVTSQSRKAGGASLALPKVRRNPLIEIIPINTGCLNSCTYCKTKHARGHLGSYGVEEIVDRAKVAFAEGVVELWLTSEDTGAWGIDLGLTLPDLLNQLVKVIPEGCRMRLGMTNPPYILDHLDQVAKVLNSDRVYAFLHVPVQSGSDSVLADMKREYNGDDFCRVVNVLRQKVPGLTVATDVICGFPTETEEDFCDTLALCRKYKFSVLYINQFYPRPGTPAAKMKRVASTQDVKKRTKALTELFHSYEPYKKRVGQKYTVLVTEVAHDKKHYVGHNEFYEQVLVPKDESLMGKLVDVEITSTCKFSMIGKVLDDGIVSPTGVDPLLPGQISGKRASSESQEEGTSWVYKLSMIVLVFAVFVRFLQLIYLAGSSKKAGDSTVQI